jgi:ribose transport system permease protein
VIAYIRLPPFIVTLGWLTAVRGFARLVGNDLTVFDPQLSFAFVGNSSLTIIPGVVSIPSLALVAFLVVIISWLILRRTVLGTHIYAVGGNESAARLAGINVAGVLLFVYGASGLLAGEGSCRRRGSTQPMASSSASPTSLTPSPRSSLAGRASSAASAASGARSLALMIAVLSNGLILLGVSDVWQYIVKGGVIIGAVALDRYRLTGAVRT